MKRILFLSIFLLSTTRAYTYNLDQGDLIQLGTTAEDFREEVRMMIDETNADLFLLKPLSCTIPPESGSVYNPTMEDAIDANSDLEQDAVDVVANLSENIAQLFAEQQVELDDFTIDRVGNDHTTPDFAALNSAATQAVKDAQCGKSDDLLFPLHDLQQQIYTNVEQAKLIHLWGDDIELQTMFRNLLKVRRELCLRCTVEFPCFSDPAWIVDDPNLPGEP